MGTGGRYSGEGKSPPGKRVKRFESFICLFEFLLVCLFELFSLFVFLRNQVSLQLVFFVCLGLFCLVSTFVYDMKSVGI